MSIKKVIPGYYKGRDINTVPYGVKYKTKKPPLAVMKVDHPGGRPFRIYHDTWKRQCGLMVKLMKKVLRDKMK